MVFEKAEEIDRLLLTIANLIYDIKHNGLSEAKLDYDKNDIVYDYLNIGLNLTKEGFMPVFLKTEMDYEFNILNNNYVLDNITLKLLKIINGLMESIRSMDYSLILTFAKCYGSKETYIEISNLFEEFMREDLGIKPLTNKREDRVKRYFKAWIKKDSTVFDELFSYDVKYIECDGAIYNGLEEVKEWFKRWHNEDSRVVTWNIKRFLSKEEFTVCQWHFKCFFKGKEHEFNGASWISFDSQDKITEIKEYGAKISKNIL